MKKTIFGVLAVAVASLALAGCGKTVQPGNEGIMIRTLINPGVQEQPLPVGWHATMIGDRILEYPVITRNYSFTRANDGDQKSINEEITFADATGLPMSADVQVTLAVDPSKVSDIYKKYRLNFDDLLYGPVRAQIRTSIAAEASKYQSMDMFGVGRQQVMASALRDVQQHFNGTGLVVSDMQWLGNVRAPESVINAIKRRTEVEQETQIALQNQKKAEAENAVRVANAEADNKVKQLEAAALNSAGGEKTIQKQWIEKWDGKLPQYIIGGNATTMMMKMPGQ